MSTISKKILSSALSVTTTVWLSGALMLVPVAHGQVDLQSQINALLAQIAQLQAQLAAAQSGGPVMSSYNYTRDLTVGSKGDDVKALQQTLINGGFLKIAAPTSYFGSLTRDALGKWQASVNISPTAGYFGPKSRAYLNSLAVAPGGPNQPPVVIGGGLNATVAFDTPPSTTALKGATNVPFLKFTLSGSGTVNSLTVTRTGAGQATDFAGSGVYLLDETGARLTTGRTVNSTTQKANFTGLNLVVNGTKTLWVVAALSTNASSSDRNAFEISSSGDISASVVVGGAYPVRGNEMTVGGATIATATVTSSTLPANPKVGEQGAKLASFKITNNASADDVKVSRVTLRYAGAVSRSNLTNFKVKYAGNVVGMGDAINSKDLVVLNFSPAFLIERGQNRIFELFGDVSPSVRSGSAETIKWYVEDTNDIVANSALYGNGATITNNFDSNNYQQVTVDGGQITITFNGPTNSDLATNGSDVNLFDFTVASANNVEVKNLRFSFTSTGMGSATNEKLSDFKVVDAATGSVVAGPYGSDITTTTTGIVLNDTWTLGAGQSRRLKVTADVGSASALGTDTMYVTLVAFNSTDIKNVDSNTDVATADIVPNGITGNTHTAKAPSLNVSLTGTPSSRTLTPGTTNVDLTGIRFQSVADDIQIKTIKISASSTLSATNLISALGSLRLMVDGAQVGQSKSLSGSALPLTAEFTNLNYTIKKSEGKTFVVNAVQLSNTASTTTYVAGIADLSTDVTAVDSQGNSLTLSGSVNPVDGSGSVVLTLATPSLTIARVGAGSTDTDTLQVMGNGQRVLTRLEFRATNGDVNVKKLQFGVSTAATNATATGLGDDVASVSLKMCADLGCTSRSSVTGLDNLAIDSTGEHAGTVKAESATGFFTIPRGESRYFTLEGAINQVQVGSADYADSGTDLYSSVRLSNFEAVSGNTTLTSYTTSTGGTSLGVAGTQKVLLRSQPALSVAKPSGAIVAVGTVPVLDVTVGADTNPIALKAFGINIAATAATVTAPTTSNVIVTELVSNTTITIGSVSGAVITGGNSGDLYIVFTNPEIISPGSPKTYRVKVTAADVSATVGAAKLTTTLDRNETAVVNSLATNNASLLTLNGAFGATSTYNIKSWVWSDLSDDQTGTETLTEWANASLLRPFPTDSFTITN